MSNENQILDAFMGLKAVNQYNITEWTSDHAHTAWWREDDILAETSISKSSKNPKDWHCIIHDKRVYESPYHKDWKILMFVFEKIECTVPLGYLQNNPYYTQIRKEIPNILKTHQAIVAFIKDYASKDPTILAA